MDLHFDQVNTTLIFREGKISTDQFRAECQGVQCIGALELVFLGGSDFDLKLTTSAIDGAAETVIHLIPAFSAVDTLALQGRFRSQEKGIILHQTQIGGKSECQFSFCGEFADVQCPLNAKSTLTGGSCGVSYNSDHKHLTIDKGFARLELLDGSSYRIQLETIDFTPEEGCTIDVRLQDAKRDNVELFIISGYRSFGEQSTLKGNYVIK